MLKTIGLFLLLISGNVLAQRLYLHEIPNGNYQSYEVGSTIVLYMLDSSVKTKGIIAKLDKNTIQLKDGTYIPIEQIASILPPDRAKPIKRFISIVGGNLLIVTGTLMFLSGALTLNEDPGLGAGIMVVSAGMFAGGVYILRKSKIAHQQVKQAIIDNVNYRIFID